MTGVVVVLPLSRAAQGPRQFVSRQRRKVTKAGDIMDFEVWKQHQDELIRQAEQDHLAKALREARGRRAGSGLTPMLTRELKGSVTRFSTLFP